MEIALSGARTVCIGGRYSPRGIGCQAPRGAAGSLQQANVAVGTASIGGRDLEAVACVHGRMWVRHNDGAGLQDSNSARQRVQLRAILRRLYGNGRLRVGGEVDQLLGMRVRKPLERPGLAFVGCWLTHPMGLLGCQRTYIAGGVCDGCICNAGRAGVR